ncbi:MAG TPA: class I SAM-dependent rRNA methyltransferase [Terriglobales bacterium]|nr:class I SAM-dependent rRNA methyltransferase [Terriglobales bacterium]
MPPASTASSNELPIIRVQARAAARLRAGHSWVYRSDLAGRGETPRAAVVRVADDKGRPLATALSSSSSQIALRVIGPADQHTDLSAWIKRRVAEAVAYRQRWVRDTDAYRVIFSEADGLPGLIVDRYNDILTLQALTQAMDRDDLRRAATDSLLAAYGRDISIVERGEARIRELEELEPLDMRQLAGSKTKTVFTMNGLRFQYEASAGQKSGAFLDQRENYAAAAQFARGAALDVFCYQGGFALHLARVCSQVTGVDSSRPALEVAEANAQLNTKLLKVPEIDWIEANAFDLLKDYADAKTMYDTIVLDPPAFAKTKRATDSAARGYKELNLRALKMLRPGGVLITHSCSHHMSESDFSAMLASAAVDAKREVRILEKRSQSKDHPSVVTIPETTYLKCNIAEVR